MKMHGARLGRNREQRGLTLMEVLVSLLISATMLVGIVSLLSFNFIYQNQQELRANAQDAILNEMEKIRHQFIWKVEPQTIVVYDNRTPDNQTDDTDATLRVRVYNRNGTELAAAPTDSDRYRVVLTVTWKGRGRMSSRTFTEELVAFIIP